MLNSKFARTIFSVAVLALGIQHFTLDYFTIEKPPSTALFETSVRVVGFFYTMGISTLAIAILCNYKLKGAASGLGVLVFCWCLVRHVPLVIVNITDPAELNSMFMALAAAGSAFIIADSVQPGSLPIRTYFFINRRVIKLLGDAFYGAAMIVFGVQHVCYASFIASLIPSWIAGNYFWAYATGVALIAAGISITFEWKSQWSSWCLGVMISIWIALIHLPRIQEHPGDHYEWTSLFQAFIIAAAAFVLKNNLTATTKHDEVIRQRGIPRTSKAKKQWHQRDPAVKSI